jgi:hypothetical protein
MKIRYRVLSCLCFFRSLSFFAERPSQNIGVDLFGNPLAHSSLSQDAPTELVCEISPGQAFENSH